MEGFYRKKGDAGEKFSKKKKRKKERVILRQDRFLRGREWQESYHVDCFFFLWRVKKAYLEDYLIGANSKLQNG